MQQEPQEKGYFLNEGDGQTKEALPALKNKLVEVSDALSDISSEWDGTVIEPQIFAIVECMYKLIGAVENEINRFGLDVRQTGLG
jgi:hypothetical protein